MKDYIRYEIEERKYSSNCLIGIYLQYNVNKGKMEEVKEKILSPFVTKKEGDVITQKIFHSLTAALVSHL